MKKQKQPYQKITRFFSLVVAAVIGLVLFASIHQPVAAVGGSQRVAYYGNWDIYANGLFLRNLDRNGSISNLTTLVYSFENINPDTLKCFQVSKEVDTSDGNPNGGDGGGDAWGDFQRPFTKDESVDGTADTADQQLRGNFNQVRELKAKYPHLKVVLSIGGWTFSKFFSDAAATPASRTAFVDSCIDMYIRGNIPTNVSNDPTSGGAGIAKGIFDGIDIDWEFPAGSDGVNHGHLGNHTSPNDASNYVSLLSNFRSQLDTQGAADGKHYLLTAAVQSDQGAATLSKASQIQSYLDWAGVMTYDMHGAWEDNGPTDFQAPLYASLIDPHATDHLSVDESITRWENAGLPASKLVMGVPFYWRGWSGVPNTNNGLYQTATGPSHAYTPTNQPGVANYKELLKDGMIKNVHTDSVTQAPWIYSNGEFYTGDTPGTLAQKGAYIRNKNLLGAMIYSLEGDDASGTLIKSVTKGLQGGVPAPAPPDTLKFTLAVTSKSSKNTATAGEPINMVGGNYLASRTEFNLPGKDDPISYALNYNSAASGQSGPVGWGWTDSYRITAVAADDSSVIIQNPDGRLDTYLPGPNNTYIAPQGMYDTLTNVNGAFKVVHKDRSVYNFNTLGLLSSIVSANGNTQTLTYDANNNLITITNSVGRKLTFTYTDSGQIATVTDNSGRVVTYTYDDVGNLATVKNQANQTTTYTYDTNHLITKVTDPRGNDVVVNVYDDQGRVTQQTDGLGNVITLAYAPGQTTYTDANGGQTIYSYDAQWRITNVRDTLGGNTATTYDAAGNVYQTTDPLGRVTTRIYDTRGNLTQVTNPAGGTQTFTYDASDNLLTATDQLNHTTTYTYDANGNVKQKTDPLGNITKFNYSTFGQNTAVIDPLNNLTGFVYDSNGNPVTKTDPSNRNTYYGYDSIGRLTAVENADLQETDYTLDATDHITQVTNPSGNNTFLNYDADGNKTKLTDANNHATNYEYDANNNLTKTTNALNQATTYTYDGNGNLIKKTDAKGRQTIYIYDLLGRQTQTTDPLGGISKLVYDAAGNVVQRIDASNRTTTYAYNNLNQLITTTYPDSTTATNTYDAVGNLLTATNTAGTTTYTYDNLGHVATVKDPHNATITYTYNPVGSLSQIKYPDNKTVSYTYTPSNQLSTAKDWNNSQTTYLYDNEGRVAVKTLPNTIKATYAYDANGNLSNLTYKKGTAAFTKYDYERDAVGNITDDTETKANGSQVYSAYTYDALNQITMDDAPNNTWSYTYDEVGNMKTSVADGTTTNYTYNNANRLTAKATRTFTYDPQGNEITDGTKTLGYNYDNQLKTYVNGSTTTNYVYDATGNRIEKSQTGANYQYVNTGNNNVVVAKNITNGTSNFFVYGVDQISQGDTSSSSRQYYLTDGLGNVRYLTNSSGTTLNTYATDPFGGNQTGTGSTANNYIYQDEQKDLESGLTYLRARYYDPSIGRFTSQDPLSGTLGDTTTQNGYNYANNNPVNFSDPSGMITIVLSLHAALGFFGFGEVNDGIAVSTNDWSVGFVSTATAGGSSGGSAGLGIDLSFSSARTVCDLGGLGTVSGGSIRAGLGADVGLSSNTSPGGQVSQELNLGVGFGADDSAGVIPGELHGGISYTAVHRIH